MKRLKKWLEEPTKLVDPFILLLFGGNAFLFMGAVILAGTGNGTVLWIGHGVMLPILILGVYLAKK